ncbi:hypothetical protein TTHT_2147 [Thermotomaculum hydrothermale]|uniref:M23ase beta-sheet core domain-containing protein n=1 Tax=Thermotomaculum hydrothermale TaxID=981385 RepID=A0A7R6PJ93_9BACT|nr:peptidoglycan DD-metalloendopeptidase family protein [Thermotomaculum hydrothermale]BBB33579.1 hypothetical protein TTHT_2147 [Thermotomaculum hydrothermale]
MFNRKVFLIILTILFFSHNLYPSESLVFTLKENIKELEQNYNRLKQQAKTVSDNIELISRKIEILKTKTKMLRLKKIETEKEIKELKSEIKKLQKDIEETKKYLKIRIKELYKKGDYTTLEALLSPSKEQEYLYQLNTLSYLSDKDKKLLRKLRKLTDEKEQKVKMLEFERKDLEETISQLSDTKKQLSQTLREQKRLFKQLKRKKSRYVSLLKERNRLLKLLVESLSKKPTPQNPSAIPMDKFKGLLSLPVSGRLIERFGTYRIGKYRAKIKNNGITLKVRKGKKVKVFYDGVVVFADWYKSYGKLIIIDHGFGYYTFYAHLDKIFVKINQTVSKGDVIATTGNTASLQGYIFHFEIWHNKKPLNPLKWVKKR